MYDRFEVLLKERGISAYKVAQETGVSTATLTSWKQGKYTPKLSKLLKIADYFGVQLAWLTGDSDFRTKEEMHRYQDDTEVKPIYKRIKMLCKEKGVTVTGTEKELGFARGSLCKIDQNRPSAERLQKLADYFGVQTAWLAGVPNLEQKRNCMTALRKRH